MLRFFTFFGLFLGFLTHLHAQHAEVAQANTYFKSFLFKEAIPLYEDALQKDPYLGDAMVNLAKCYYYTNKPKEAALWYARILRYDGYKQYAFDYGLVLKMTGQYSEAKRWFRESMRNNSMRGTHFANSCDFALKANPLDEVYGVTTLPAINSKSADFAPTFHYEQLIFSSSRSIAVTKNGEVAWTNDAFNQHYLAEVNSQKEFTGAQVLRSYVGNDINDAPMSYAPTEDLVVITSNNFMDGIRHVDGSGLMMDLYLYKTKSLKEWDVKTQKFFPFNANVDTKRPFSTGHPCLADKGMTLYFCSNRPGGYGGYDIYKSRRTATGWSVPQNLGHPINTAGNEMSPFVDGDGRLYFASDWHHGYGGLDVFMSSKTAYGWGEVQNLGKQVNSSADDFYFILDVSSKVGYFTSNRAGGRGHEDIYQVRQQRALPKRQVTNLSVGTKFILNDRYFKAGDGGLHNTSDRQLYDILQRLIDNPTAVVQINGYTDAVGSASSNLALSKERAGALASFFITRGVNSNRIKVAGYGESFLVNDCGDNRRCTAEERAENRRLEVVVVGNFTNNVINITYDAAPAPNADKIVQDAVAMAVASKKVVRSSSSSSSSSSSYKKAERKDHYAIGDKIEVANVFYEHGKSSIDYKKSPGLKDLLEILNQHQHVVVEIGAHTDASGSAKYNRELSEKRAIAVKKYLEKKGIPSSRLVARGYGESQLLNRCKDGVDCSKEENALNRRTEFKIIGQKGFKVGDIIKVDDINYELDKAKLDMADSRGLTEVIQLLKDNQISVEIRSHTDSRGTSSYNEELSEKRAKAVYDHLVKNGISKHRLKYKGYGESKLLNKCKDGVRCSSSEHAENRRTDFRVIGLR